MWEILTNSCITLVPLVGQSYFRSDTTAESFDFRASEKFAKEFSGGDILDDTFVKRRTWVHPRCTGRCSCGRFPICSLARCDVVYQVLSAASSRMQAEGCCTGGADSCVAQTNIIRFQMFGLLNLRTLLKPPDHRTALILRFRINHFAELCKSVRAICHRVLSFKFARCDFRAKLIKFAELCALTYNSSNVRDRYARVKHEVRKAACFGGSPWISISRKNNEIMGSRGIIQIRWTRDYLLHENGNK